MEGRVLARIFRNWVPKIGKCKIIFGCLTRMTTIYSDYNRKHEMRHTIILQSHRNYIKVKRNYMPEIDISRDILQILGGVLMSDI